MRKHLIAAAAIATLALSPAAFAQDTKPSESMGHNTMAHDSGNAMAHDTMSHGTTAHDAMGHDSMSHGTTSHNAMNHDDSGKTN